MQRELNYVVDIGQRIIEQPLNEPLFTHEQNAHAIRVTLLKNGSPVTLSELAQCNGYFLHEDTQVTDRAEGSIEGNVATVVIQPDTYLTPGFIRISIEVIDGDESLVVLMLSGSVKITRSSNVYDPTGVALPDLDELITDFQQLAAMASEVEGWIEDVTATIALPFSADKVGGYKIGEFSIKDGLLYRCVVNHTGAWVAAHFEATNVANELERVRDEERQARIQLIDAVSYLGEEGPDDMVTLLNAANGAPVKAVVTIEPQQDLHGYEKPWVGGAGKNLCPPLGAKTETVDGITYTVENDGSVFVTAGTASKATAAYLSVPFVVKSGVEYVLNGCPTGGSVDGYRLDLRTNSSTLYRPDGIHEAGDYGSNLTFTPMEDATVMVAVRFASGYSIPSGGIKFYPMVRLASETDATYEPYSNICPITGYDDVTTKRVGKNLLTLVDYAWQNNTGIKVVDHTAFSSDDLIKTNPGEKFTYYRNIALDANKSLVMRRYDANKNYLSGNGPGMSNSSSGYLTVEVPADTYYVAFTQYGAVGVSGLQVQVERGDSFTGYEEPSIQSVTVNVKSINNGNAVYGGTLTINKDGTGTLVVDRAMATENTFGAITSGSAMGHYVNADNTGAKYVGADSSSIYCNMAPADNANGWNMNYPTVQAGGVEGRLRVYGSFTTLAEFKQQFAGLQICYLLSTPPAPYTLTASQITTLLGTNHVWSDADSIEVEYTMDTTHKFDAYDSGMSNLSENLSTLAGSIADQDGQFGTADEAHEQGDLFMWGTQLVRAKTAIVINDQIVLDTNVEEATVEEELDGVKDDISDLKSALNALLLGRLDYPLITNSYVTTTGDIQPYNGWSRTDYIPVSKYQKLTTVSSARSEYNCFYNENKGFVSFFRVYTTETSVDVPDNAAYVIFSNTNAGMENLSVSFTTKTEKAIDDLNNELQDTNDAVDALSASIERQKSKLQFQTIPIHTPDGFTWVDNPITGRIYTDYNGYFNTDFDVADYEPSGGVTYYVSPTGLDTNDGLTPDTPLKKMSTAYNKADCGCIVLRGGVYNQGNNLTSTKITKNISIKAYKDEKPIITTHSGSTFSVYSGNTYSANRSYIDLVMDMAETDSYGIFKVYERMTSIEDVQSTEGTYAHISGVLYIHCIGNREPDSNILLMYQADNLYAEGNPVVYLEGLTVIGGYSPVVVSNTQSNTNPKFYAKNCDFLYSFTTGNDAVMLQGTELSIIQNCRAMHSMKDGFNYHAQNGTIPKAIEINCTGAFCGNIEDSNDQGSTIHDGGSIIRVNGAYFDNYGSNVADEASECWNIGCISFEPLAPNAGQRGCFLAITDTKMWLDSCTMFGKPHYPILATNDGTTSVYLRNNRIESAGSAIIYGTTPIYY